MLRNYKVFKNNLNSELEFDNKLYNFVLKYNQYKAWAQTRDS